jgi:transcriptional regulator with GAF, ATPase, and Fis domain
VIDDPSTSPSGREALATSTLVELVETLVDDFDVIDLLTLLTGRVVALLDASAAGILLGDDRGRLRVLASSSDQAELLELFQIQNDEGPCLDCYTSGEVVATPDLSASSSAWPTFASEAVRLGFRSVCAVPLHLQSETMGCLNLFLSQPGGLSDEDLRLARALADVSTIAMVQDQALREAAVRERQLQQALDSRVVIEQAKGMIAERADVDMSEAFRRLRTHARNHNLLLTELAAGLLDRSVPIDDVIHDEALDPPR